MVIAALIVLLTVLLAPQYLPTALSQPEPPSPEEEWYPPPPSENRSMAYDLFTSGTGTVPAPGTLSLEILDVNGRVRRELYGSERFYLRFTSPYNTFFIYLYEWYPSGTVPKGHWLIFGAGPVSTGSGVMVSIGYFMPELGEPEGIHVWKCWLFNPAAGKWSTGIIRFGYYRFPRAIIERVVYPSDLVVGGSYQLSVYVRNTGEVGYSYTVKVEGVGVSVAPAEQGVSIQAKSSTSLAFQLNILSPGDLKIKVTVLADGVELDSKSYELKARILKPGPMVMGGVSPTMLRVREEARIEVTFTNRGEGAARQVMAYVEAPGFAIIKGSDFSPDVPAGGAGRVEFVLKPLEGGRKSLRIVVSYRDEAGNTYVDELYVDCLVLVRVRVDIRSIEGEQLDLEFRVDGNSYTSSYDEWLDPSKGLELEVPQVVERGRTRYVFVGWSDGVEAVRRRVSLSTSTSFSATYRVEYLVELESLYGDVRGGGWHPKGSEVEVGVEPASVGFGIKMVFDHWEDERGSVVSRQSVFKLIVDEPTSLRAVWRADYTELLALTLVAVVIATLTIVVVRQRM